MNTKQEQKISLLEHIKQIAEFYKLELDLVANIFAESLKKVYLKEFYNNKIGVNIDLENNNIKMWRYLEVVSDDYFNNEGDEDDETLIPHSQALQLAENRGFIINIGDHIKKTIDISEFDAKTVRNIILIYRQLINEAINKQTYRDWIEYKNTIVDGVVEKIDETNKGEFKGAVVALTNKNGQSVRAYIVKNEFSQFMGKNGERYYEKLLPGKSYCFYVKNVHELSSGWPINLTRNHEEIVKHYMRLEIPELQDGTLTIEKIARISGVKTKVLVRSHSITVDPVGACLGAKSKRLKAICDHLSNEKIDIIAWSNDEVKNIINSAIPGKVLGYQILDHENKEIVLIAEDYDAFSAIIGKRGINVKLISMLNGWNIDVKKQSDAIGEGIRFQFADELLADDNKSIIERIFDLHKINNENVLNQLEQDLYNSDNDRNDEIEN